MGVTCRQRAGLADDEGGVAAVEFAVLLPLLLLLFFGGITIVNAVNISRKVTITTRALADLTSQYAVLQQSDMNTIKNASAEILAPYNTTPLSMRISEFAVTTTKVGVLFITSCSVVWSSAQGPNMSAYLSGVGSSCTVPSGLVPSPSGLVTTATVYLIYAETSYTYTTLFGNIGPLSAFGVQWIPNGFGTYNLGDRIFMLPRLSTSIAYSGS